MADGHLAVCLAEGAWSGWLLEWLAAAVSQFIDTTTGARSRGVNDDGVKTMIDQMTMVGRYADTAMMSFDLKAYLAMLKKGQIADIVREVGAGDIADKIPGMKKAQAEAVAYEAIKDKRWLPPQIRLEKE